MCETFGIDAKTRFLVLYFDAKMGISEISMIINKSTKTIREWESRTNSGEDIRTKHKERGGKKQITQEIENEIIQLVNDNPGKVSAAKLATRFGVSKRTISRVLTKSRLECLRYETEIQKFEQDITTDSYKRTLANESNLIFRTLSFYIIGVKTNKICKKKGWQLEENEKKQKTGQNVLGVMNWWESISAQEATIMDSPKEITEESYQQYMGRHEVETERIYSDEDYFFVPDDQSFQQINEVCISMDNYRD